MGIALAALATSALVAAFFTPLLIRVFQKRKMGQTVRSDGPSEHLKKSGTPTMGGIVFLPAAAVSMLIWGGTGRHTWFLLAVLLGFGLIGFWDDALKVIFRRSLGLKARSKLILQFLLSFIMIFLAERLFGVGTAIGIPAFGWVFDLGWLYYPLMTIFFVGMINAVNLTDGLDGLAAGISAFVFIGFAVIALFFLDISESLEISASAAGLAGVCLGFLLYNRFPAKVFMGDTGSLLLGGGVAALAIMTKSEFLLILLGGVYLIEALSVIIQVFAFRCFGRRVFRMSPLHHHFELLGWKETTVVKVFCLAAAALTGLALLLAAS